MGYSYSRWCETIEPSQTASLALDAADNSLICTVTGSELTDFLQFTLPLAAVRHLSPNDVRLLRSPPVQWPFIAQQLAYARRVKTEGFGAHEATRAPSGLDGVTPPTYVYPRYQCLVEFAPVDYDIYDDAYILAGVTEDSLGRKIYEEWKRNCVIRFLPSAEPLTVDGSMLQFAENPTPPLPQTILGTPFDARQALIERKGVLSVLWKNVPAGFVLTNRRFPRQFFRALGKVNSTQFLGCDPETLAMFDAPEFLVKPLGIRDIQYTYQFPWQYDILMKFRYFNPPKGNSSQDHNGWNLFPPRGMNKYLYATRRPFNSPADYLNDNSDATAEAAFDTFEFRYLFQYANY